MTSDRPEDHPGDRAMPNPSRDADEVKAAPGDAKTVPVPHDDAAARTSEEFMKWPESRQP